MAANWLDRVALAVAPRWGLSRLRSRVAATMYARHYDAASGGRRTSGWPQSRSDANAAAKGSLGVLRNQARDLVRNNGWARNGLRTIAGNTVGWGLRPKAEGLDGGGATELAALWKRWAETTACDADSRLTFYGIQKLAMRQVAESGEVLIRRRWRLNSDGLPLPIQLQVLEADFLDHTRDNFTGQEGGPVIQGIEYDAIGRRVAYWLFGTHPGAAMFTSPVSKRYSVTDILHVYDVERAGQVRGVTWFSPAIVKLRDFDEFEDAELMRQKIAACFSGYVTDVDGTGAPLGAQDASQPGVESFEPGTIQRLGPGQDIEFASPPQVVESGFSVRTLRNIAAGLGVTYEQLTGDYSQVNFSSARMGMLRHWANVDGWRWDMLVPQLCDPAWRWFAEAAMLSGAAQLRSDALPTAQWTPPPQPTIDPDKEGLALMRAVRSGAKTPSEMVREQGFDPDEHWAEYAKDMDKLHALGIVLDSDASKTSSTGQAQAVEDPAAAGDGPGTPPKNGAVKNGKVSPAAA